MAIPVVYFTLKHRLYQWVNPHVNKQIFLFSFYIVDVVDVVDVVAAAVAVNTDEWP